MDGPNSKVDRVLGWALVVLMGVAVVNVLWQVAARFVLDVSSSFSTELSRFLLIWIGILGAAYAVGQNAHLALELLPNRLEGRRRQWLELFIQGSVLFFALIVMVGGGSYLIYLQLLLGQTSSVLHVPMGYVYTVLPLSGLLIAFYVGRRMTACIRKLRRPDTASEVNGTGAGAEVTPSDQEYPSVPE